MSSSAGFAVSAGRGLYGASKFAVEAISEALHAELQPLGIAVTAVEPDPSAPSSSAVTVDAKHRWR